MTFGELRQASRQSRAAGVVVARGLLALLFAFYVNYIPYHLLRERHLDDAGAAGQLAAVHADDHDAADHDGHDGHHRPHPSSEHSLQILRKSESVFLCIAFLPAVTVLVLDAPDSHVSPALAEHIWPPGESPPEPSQPRAPPIA